MPATIFIQQVFHVFEKFHVATLVTGNSNSLHIFFNCRFHNFFLLAQMNVAGAGGGAGAGVAADGDVRLPARGRRRSDEPLTIDTPRYRLRNARSQYAPYSDFDIAIAAIPVGAVHDLGIENGQRPVVTARGEIAAGADADIAAALLDPRLDEGERRVGHLEVDGPDVAEVLTGKG